jgi:SHS family lactate transporter-like MFS transporter
VDADCPQPGLIIYMVVLMMCFNLFSHGTQDLYPTFLLRQLKFDPTTVGWISTVANVGAIVGGLTFGHISERIGRVNAITVAALLALPALPLWAYSAIPVLLGGRRFGHAGRRAGAWSVIPAHLNELAPGAARAAIPAFVHQAGNFLASYNAPFRATIAESKGGDFAFALVLVAGIVAAAIAVIVRLSPERCGGRAVSRRLPAASPGHAASSLSDWAYPVQITY